MTDRPNVIFTSRYPLRDASSLSSKIYTECVPVQILNPHCRLDHHNQLQQPVPAHHNLWHGSIFLAFFDGLSKLIHPSLALYLRTRLDSFDYTTPPLANTIVVLTTGWHLPLFFSCLFELLNLLLDLLFQDAGGGGLWKKRSCSWILHSP